LNTACGCCTGIDAATPRRIDNPPSLPNIAYRIGHHGDFLESMRAQLSSSDTPALAALTTREASDFSLALTDALATSLDVLSFYTERFAHEHYLRTATERLSVREMARLIGYQLAPGVAASTHLAFTLQTAPGIPTEPIQIPIGTRVQSVPDQDQQAQSFETIAPVPARADWNAIAVQQSKPWVAIFGDTELWLTGLDTDLAAGDLLLIMGAGHEFEPQDDHWTVQVITQVGTDATRNLTRVRWQQGLGHDRPFVPLADEGIRIFTFGTRTAVLGHSAPDWRALSDESKAAYLGLASPDNLERPGDTEEWPEYTVLAPLYPERRSGSGEVIDTHIDATVDDIVAAANGAAQGAAALAMHQAANAGTGVVMAGGQIADSAMTLVRQSVEGLAGVAKLSVDEVVKNARQVIYAQGQSLQSLQMSAENLIQNAAIYSIRGKIDDLVAGLPLRIQEYVTQG